MTIQKIINAISTTTDMDITDSEIISYLSNIDARIKREIIDFHINDKYKDWKPYTIDTPKDTELIVPDGYSDLYLFYVKAQLDYKVDEIDRYTNNMIMFNQEYAEFYKWYARTYRSNQSFSFEV